MFMDLQHDSPADTGYMIKLSVLHAMTGRLVKWTWRIKEVQTKKRYRRQVEGMLWQIVI